MDKFRVGVVGAGFMGSGIAESVARAGFSVTVIDQTPHQLARSRRLVADSLDRAVASGKLAASECAAGRSHRAQRRAARPHAGRKLVVEAVFEDPG